MNFYEHSTKKKKNSFPLEIESRARTELELFLLKNINHHISTATISDFTPFRISPDERSLFCLTNGAPPQLIRRPKLFLNGGNLLKATPPSWVHTCPRFNMPKPLCRCRPADCTHAGLGVPIKAALSVYTYDIQHDCLGNCFFYQARRLFMSSYSILPSSSINNCSVSSKVQVCTVRLHYSKIKKT